MSLYQFSQGNQRDQRFHRKEAIIMAKKDPASKMAALMAVLNGEPSAKKSKAAMDFIMFSQASLAHTARLRKETTEDLDKHIKAVHGGDATKCVAGCPTRDNADATLDIYKEVLKTHSEHINDPTAAF